MRRCGDVEKCPLALQIWSSVDEFPNEVKIGKRWQKITEVGKMGSTLWKMTKASNENWTTVTKKVKNYQRMMKYLQNLLRTKIYAMCSFLWRNMPMQIGLKSIILSVGIISFYLFDSRK